MPVGDIRMHARRLTQTCDKEYAPFCVHPVENTFSNSSGATHYVASTFFIYLWSFFLFVYSMICHLSNVCTNTVSFRLGSDSNITKIIPISRERSDFFFLAMLFHANEYLPFTDIPHPLGLPVHSNGIHSNEE